MNYYIIYYLPNTLIQDGEISYRIKHFEVKDNENISLVAEFIDDIVQLNYENIRIKASSIPMYDPKCPERSIPYLNVATEEQFNNLQGVDVTDRFINPSK